MFRPGVIITGATGFVGSRLIQDLSPKYEIYALGRRLPAEAGTIEGPGIHWFQADVADFDSVREVFYRIQELGGAEIVLHLAGYYDFSGEDNPAYQHTNVEGTRHVLELSIPLQVKLFVFTSSIAVCRFVRPGKVITEETPPDAPPPYSRSKRAAEELVQEYRHRLPTAILRLAAICDDWCRYEPLANSLEIWCSNQWHARILPGRGHWAVPYLHIQELVEFFLKVIEKHEKLRPAEILQASPDGATSLLDLYRVATCTFFGALRAPIFLPKSIAHIGIMMREDFGRITGNIPFERTWMGDYIDAQLTVNAAYTRRRLGWIPNPDHDILKRLPILIQNMQHSPDQWAQAHAYKKQQTTQGALDFFLRRLY
jgi:nucleoside-diphosphate-sugar epimerase